MFPTPGTEYSCREHSSHCGGGHSTTILITAVPVLAHSRDCTRSGYFSEVALIEKAVRDLSQALDPLRSSLGFCLPVQALFPLEQGERWLNMPPDSSSVYCGPCHPVSLRL